MFVRYNVQINIIDVGAVQSVSFRGLSRGVKYTVPLLEFEFIFELPKLRKERFIVARDKLGRIVKTKVPDLALMR